MATVAGIRFKKAGKVYYFDPTGVWPSPSDLVVVETARGLELGEAVTGAREVADEQIVAPLKRIVRMATEEDIKRAQTCAEREKQAFGICVDKIASHKLEMKLVDVEFTFDGSKVIFYFTANGRVDFRELVKDLASVFKTRIELRQIGVRDEAKMLGGLGACGRPICCAAFLSDFQPVSIKMAKEQNLSLNPTKISGQCGRLMCCLKYEQDYYDSALRKLPRIGREIMTPDGIGVVTEIGVIRERVKVRIHQNDDTYETREYPLDSVCRPGEAMPEKADESADDAEAADGEEQLAENGLLISDICDSVPEADAAEPEAPQKRDGAQRTDRRPPRPRPAPAQEAAKRRYPRPKKNKQSLEQFVSDEDARADQAEARESVDDT